MANQKWLKSFGPIGNFISTVIAVVTANWGLAVSAVAGLAGATWAGLTSFFQRSDVEVGIGLFLATLWTCVGLTILYDRSRPRLTSPAPDYRYGLGFDGISPLFFPHSQSWSLMFGLIFRNLSPVPSQYHFESCDIRISSRSMPRLKSGVLSGYLAKGAVRQSNFAAFQQSDIHEFFGKVVAGTIEFTVKYGAPDEPPVRQLTMSWNITLQFPTEEEISKFPNNRPMSIGFNSMIISDKDVPISIP